MTRSSSRPGRLPPFALITSLTMSFSGCGGDGQAGTTEPTTTEPSTTEPTSTEPTTTEPTTTEPTENTPSEACDALSGVSIGGAKLSDATLVAAANGVGEHCKVTGLIGTSLRFEVELPSEWNKKLL